MKIKHLSLLTVTALCAAFALPAYAQVSRIYFAGYLGLNTFNEMSFSESTSGASGDFKVDNATSFAGALGLRLNRNTRLEAELSYRTGDISSADFSTGGTYETSGDISSKFLFLSLYHDFNMPRWKLQPYVGAGLGVGFHEANIVDTSGIAVTTSSDNTTFAYHIGAGVKYRMSPNLALTGGYRYIGSDDLEINGYQIDYSAQEFRFGLEYDLPFRGSSRSRYR